MRDRAPALATSLLTPPHPHPAGSIGTQTLDIAAEHADRFEIVALSAGGNISLLAEQTRQFKPSLVSIADASNVAAFKELIKGVSPQPEIMTGAAGISAVAAHRDADAVVTGIVGCAGLTPPCAAIRAGKDICLANKETLIAGAPAVLPLAAAHGVRILPADSEHSAIFQVIQGLPEGGLRRIILTASGGSFRDLPVEKLASVTVADALKHPNWRWAGGVGAGGGGRGPSASIVLEMSRNQLLSAPSKKSRTPPPLSAAWGPRSQSTRPPS